MPTPRQAVYIWVIAMSNAFAFYLYNWFCVFNTVHFPSVLNVLSNRNHHCRATICPDGCRFAYFFNISKYFNHLFLLRITTFYRIQELAVLHLSLKVRLLGALSVCGMIVKDTKCLAPRWCSAVSAKVHRPGPLLRENQLTLRTPSPAGGAMVSFLVSGFLS